MIPVLDYVEFHASDFHLASDARFYWSTGLLSGVLDNAPTYLTFLTAGLSLDHFDLNRLPDVADVPTPGFLAYIIKYALPILIPVVALVGHIFFRG